MYRKEFENLLKKNPPRAVFLYGDSNYLISLYIKYYIDISDTSNSLRKEYFDAYSFQSAKNYLSEVSLFGNKNLLLIKRDKKIAKWELKRLIELVNRSSNNYLIFHFLGSTKDAKSMQSLFNSKTGAVWVRVFEPSQRESISLLEQKAKEIGLKIDYYALEHLISILNNDLTLSMNELNKLSILNYQVTSRDIDRLVYSTAPIAMERFLIELFEKRPIIKILNKIFELGEDEFSILRSTQFFLNQLSLFHTFWKINGYINSSSILGYQLPKNIEERRTKLAMEIKLESILKIYELLLDVELNLKDSQSTNQDLILYSAFIKLQSYL